MTSHSLLGSCRAGLRALWGMAAILVLVSASQAAASEPRIAYQMPEPAEEVTCSEACSAREASRVPQTKPKPKRDNRRSVRLPWEEPRTLKA